MSRNDLIVREQEARNIVGAKAKQISVLVGKDEAKTSKFMSALVQLSQNKNLIECKVDTIVDVGFQIVQAGLNPNPLFGQAYVVPFKLKSGFTVAQLQVGYKGYIQLGYRAGWKFKAVPVYKCDKFDYKFGGFEDDIVLEPNYEARNEDDGNWIFKNLVGVIVYAKDKDDYIVTEFVAFKKLEKLRLKSQNQVKDKLQYIWLDWAEEMYKAKALKYVVTRLPIEDDVQELISSEDSVYKMEDTLVVKETKAKQNINDLNSLAIDVEVSAPKELTPKELLINELLNRGLTQEEAGKWCFGKKDDEFNSYLNDPASIDTILEEIRGF
ncbi:recombinase RecT [Aliarcobacter cryaerophilus]|uniref:recombinase RecT n=1 Tax=Aliarcobacter cryaerophilus TaxID=28198 RepID=UPI003DA40C02